MTEFAQFIPRLREMQKAVRDLVMKSHAHRVGPGAMRSTAGPCDQSSMIMKLAGKPCDASLATGLALRIQPLMHANHANSNRDNSSRLLACTQCRVLLAGAVLIEV